MSANTLNMQDLYNLLSKQTETVEGMQEQLGQLVEIQFTLMSIINSLSAQLEELKEKNK